MIILFEKKSITPTTPLTSNAENFELHRISKLAAFFRGDASTSLVCWMVMVCLYLLMNMVLVVENAVTAVLGLCEELFLMIDVAFQWKYFMTSALEQMGMWVY